MSVPASSSQTTPRVYADEDLLTPSEVAAIFRVDPKTVTRWAAARPPRIKSTRTPGGHRRFAWREVRRLLADDQAEQGQS